MPIISLTDWNHFLAQHPNAHLLQTGEWGELKSAFGWKPVRITNGDAGVQILFRRLPLGFTLGYIPKANFDQSLLPEIDFACKQNRAVFIKFEPDLWDDQEPETWNLELETSPHNIQPPRTIIIDIRGTEDEILAKMKQKTRYNIRLAEKKGVTVRTSDDIESFHKMMTVTGGRDGFGIHSLEYYKRAYELLQPKGRENSWSLNMRGSRLLLYSLPEVGIVPTISTAPPQMRNVIVCQLTSCNGKPLNGQKHMDAKNTISGGCQMKMKKNLKRISKRDMTACGASIASNADLAVNSNVLHRHWTESIIRYCIGHI